MASPTSGSEDPSNEPGVDLTTIREHLQAGRFDAALGGLDRLLTNQPDDTELLYTRAVTLRYARRFDAAHDTLRQIKTLAPNHGRAHHGERGR